MRGTKWFHAVGGFGLALALAGCGGGEKSEAAREAPGQAALRTRELQREAFAPVRAALRRTLAVEGPLQVLALSGGGQWGAFGAGFLKGWTKSGRRPESFRIVTGTSTGSLIATFAFLGPEYDERAGQAYLEIRGDEDVMNKRLLPFAALFQDALADTKPLRRLIEKHVTAAMVQAVADEAVRGRKLYVGAADVDRGVFRAFDLTEIASRSGEGARREYVDALMASTAIPVAFPPVVIDGRTYVDGGVRRNVFLELVVDELGRRVPAPGALLEPATVYCLVNGSLNVGFPDPPPRPEHREAQRRHPARRVDRRQPPADLRPGATRGPALPRDAHPPGDVRRGGVEGERVRLPSHEVPPRRGAEVRAAVRGLDERAAARARRALRGERMRGGGHGCRLTGVGLLLALCGHPALAGGARGSEGALRAVQAPPVSEPAPFKSFALYVLSRGKGVPAEAREALGKVRDLAEADRERGIAVRIQTKRIGLEGEKRLCFEYEDEMKARRLFDRATALVSGVDLARVVVETCAEPEKGAEERKGAEP